LKTAITKGLEPDVAKEIRGDFKSSLLIRKRLQFLITEMIETNRKSLRQRTNYENAAWPFLQADGVGYERALMEINSLLDDNNSD
jgi:hypothetical protein